MTPHHTAAPARRSAPRAGRPAVTWEQARATARDAVQPLPAATLEPADALGHALAAPLAARTDLPPFDTSAMDGWAVAGPGPWRLEDRTLLAGTRPAPLRPGAAAPIATGARLPAGATAVLRREHGATDPATGTLHVRSAAPGAAPGTDIRVQGHECRTGDPLLPAGATVTPAVLGLAAAAGHDRLTVHRRPTVELLVLGDELLTSGLPGDGRVRDALGPLLPPWLHALGAEVTGHHRVPDAAAPLTEAVRRSSADVVVTTGSTAAGPVDFLHRALRANGAELLVDSGAVRPGHPMLLAALPGTGPRPARHLVGLPGNPLAAVAGLVTLAAPLLGRLGGRTPDGPHRARAAAALPGHPADTRLVPVRRAENGVTPLPYDGPAMLRGLARADHLAVLPPGGATEGEYVTVLPLPTG
ncbi:molybdopterin molybdotransferase MoeA [Streptomyces albidoflavus]|uniref:molybdopterin molybdotransferase MoeA n=2 Tax=Streptomyces albidoflavus TaxID=1886 RepID=UPI00259AF157|nr:molybdopterin molybdotransferase MoeA [Streptomyces albidoflavus]WJK65215.1 molybdopterin molybdotransferase MoeA [Streptomyces albidoflavus]WTD85496.1 molybdopterin molybdotransferase MoeA [Streptomyces albidoflavus]